MTPQIVILGAAILDVLVNPASEAVFQTGSYGAEDIRLSTGGDAFNEAIILSGLGKQVQLRTVIGTDAAGRFIQDRCQENGIEMGPDCIRQGLSTGINVVLVTDDGERHFLTNANGSLRNLTLSDVSEPFPDSARVACFASLFVSPKIGPGEMEILFSQIKAQGKILCADLTKCKQGETLADLAPALRYVDYLFPNAEEACLLTGMSTPEAAAEAFLSAGVSHVIIKSGAKGCYVRDASTFAWVSPEAAGPIVDSTGAGDSFAAGFLNALLEDEPILTCAQEGNRCGARCIRQMGATDWIREIP